MGDELRAEGNSPIRSSQRASNAPRHYATVHLKGRLWARDNQASLFLGILLTILIIYWTVPPDIFTPVDTQVVMMSANPLSRAVKLVLLSLGALVILWRMSLTWLLFKRVNVFFLIFLLLVPLSYLWSISPSNTLARYISILSVVSVCAAFCLAGWHDRRFANVMRVALALFLCASLVFGLSEPRLAIEQGTGTLLGAWHGLATQKNPFGQLASFGVIFWLHGWLTRQTKPWTTAVFGGTAAACLWLSRSSTSLLATVFVALLMLLLLRSPANLRRYMPVIISLFVAMVLVYALAVLDVVPGLHVLLDPITAITGKDTTFSNRSEIWNIIKDHVQLRPLLGSGYGAYWIGPLPSSPSYVFLMKMFFYPTESHNGYLEIMNDLGLVGLCCLLAYLVVFVRQSLSLMKVDRPLGTLFLCLFFQQALINLSESCWFAINSAATFVIMTCATLALGRSLLELDLRHYFRSNPIPRAAELIRQREQLPP